MKAKIEVITTLYGFKLTVKLVVAKNFAIKKIKLNTHPQAVSKKLMNGRQIEISTLTNKTGYKTEKIGTTIKLIKNERKLKVE